MSSRRRFLKYTVATSLMPMIGSFSENLSAQNVVAQPRKSLKTYKIPRTDLVVSRIAYGCAMLSLDWESADFIQKAKLAMRTAYENGITFFDLADMYGWGQSETALGELLKQSPGLRNKIVIQSKCGDSAKLGSTWGTIDSRRDYIVKAVQGSLKRLGTDRLDVLLLHWPDSLVQPEEVASAFDQLERSGQVRHFGVSNHSRDQIELLRKYVRQPLVINQIQLGLGCWFARPEPWKGALTHSDAGAVMVDYCRVQDIQVQAYSPLRAGHGDKAPNLLKPAADAPPTVKQAAQLLADVARKYEVSPAAVMLAWLLHHPAGIVPITGAVKPEQVADSCTADRITLTRDEWYGLLLAAAAIHSPEQTGQA